jgi:uncharacterized membrane protein YkoI
MYSWSRRFLMKRVLTTISISALALAAAFASEKPIKMKDLPPAVQKTIREQTTRAQLKGLSKEVENGKTFYEAETSVNGHGRDILIDPAGAVVEVEEEVTIDSIPAPARTEIEKRAAGGKITKIESVTKGNTVTYEAAVLKAGKRSEIVVAADGSVQK